MLFVLQWVTLLQFNNIVYALKVEFVAGKNPTVSISKREKGRANTARQEVRTWAESENTDRQDEDTLCCEM